MEFALVWPLVGVVVIGVILGLAAQLEVVEALEDLVAGPIMAVEALLVVISPLAEIVEVIHGGIVPLHVGVNLVHDTLETGIDRSAVLARTATRGPLRQWQPRCLGPDTHHRGVAAGFSDARLTRMVRTLLPIGTSSATASTTWHHLAALVVGPAKVLIEPRERALKAVIGQLKLLKYALGLQIVRAVLPPLVRLGDGTGVVGARARAGERHHTVGSGDNISASAGVGAGVGAVAGAVDGAGGGAGTRAVRHIEAQFSGAAVVLAPRGGAVPGHFVGSRKVEAMSMDRIELILGAWSFVCLVGWSRA